MAHNNQAEIAAKVADAQTLVEVGGIYCHYKDSAKWYQVTALAVQESSLEVCVVYKALYGEPIQWIRSISDFLAEVETVNGKAQRFQKV